MSNIRLFRELINNHHGVFVQVVTNRFEAMQSRNCLPHYTDSRFKNTAHTVYIEKGYKAETPSSGSVSTVPGAHYVYSDRLDYDGLHRGYDWAATLDLQPRSAAYYEAMLCEAMEKPVKLVHIVAGVNASNGYPYLVFGMMEVE